MAVADPRAEMEKAGSVSAKYFGQTALNLQTTRYGQQAIAIDHSGYLSKRSKGTGATTPTLTMMP